jgi:energy-coupling factor transporter transmembrane protein EcfT
VLQAAQESLVVVGIVAVFAAFNAVVSHYELVQTVPRAFYELGLIVVIALAVVPTTIEAVHDVREADKARTGGRVVRKGRLIRQLVPVLERGLERAVTLSESLDSRGFAHSGSTARQRGAGWLGLGALLALGGAFVALVGREESTALALAAVGGGALVVAVVLSSRATQRIRYRPRSMRSTDWWCVAAVLLTPALLIVLAVIGDDSTFVWTPSPVHWPQVDVLAALAFVPLLAPLARAPAAAPAVTAEMSVA